MRRALVLLAIALLSGCHKQTISQGFHFELDNLPATRVEAPVAVTIIDARPDWERRVFTGTVSLIPIENLDSMPTKLLKREIQQQLSELSDPPQNARIVLNSYRIIVCKEAPLPHFERPWLPTDDPLPASATSHTGDARGEALFLAFCVAVVGTVDAAILSYDAFEATSHLIRHAHSRPKELVTNYPNGVTCDICVALTVEWSDGRCKELEVRACGNGTDLATEGHSPHDLNREVNLAVRAACAELVKECKNHILDPNLTDSPARKAPVPIFTAHSGN